MASGEWRVASGRDAIYRVCTEVVVSGEWRVVFRDSDPSARSARSAHSTSQLACLTSPGRDLGTDKINFSGFLRKESQFLSRATQILPKAS